MCQVVNVISLGLLLWAVRQLDRSSPSDGENDSTFTAGGPTKLRTSFHLEMLVGTLGIKIIEIRCGGEC